MFLCFDLPISARRRLAQALIAIMVSYVQPILCLSVLGGPGTEIVPCGPCGVDRSIYRSLPTFRLLAEGKTRE